MFTFARISLWARMRISKAIRLKWSSNAASLNSVKERDSIWFNLTVTSFPFSVLPICTVDAAPLPASTRLDKPRPTKENSSNSVIAIVVTKLRAAIGAERAEDIGRESHRSTALPFGKYLEEKSMVCLDTGRTLSLVSAYKSGIHGLQVCDAYSIRRKARSEAACCIRLYPRGTSMRWEYTGTQDMVDFLTTQSKEFLSTFIAMFDFENDSRSNLTLST